MAVTDLTNTTWKLKEPFNKDEEQIICNVNFISNSENFVLLLYTPGEGLFYVNENDEIITVYNEVADAYVEKYKTFTITGGYEVTNTYALDNIKYIATLVSDENNEEGSDEGSDEGNVAVKKSLIDLIHLTEYDKYVKKALDTKADKTTLEYEHSLIEANAQTIKTLRIEFDETNGYVIQHEEKIKALESASGSSDISYDLTNETLIIK